MRFSYLNTCRLPIHCSNFFHPPGTPSSFQPSRMSNWWPVFRGDLWSRHCCFKSSHWPCGSFAEGDGDPWIFLWGKHVMGSQAIIALLPLLPGCFCLVFFLFDWPSPTNFCQEKRGNKKMKKKKRSNNNNSNNNNNNNKPHTCPFCPTSIPLSPGIRLGHAMRICHGQLGPWIWFLTWSTKGNSWISTTWMVTLHMVSQWWIHHWNWTNLNMFSPKKIFWLWKLWTTFVLAHFLVVKCQLFCHFQKQIFENIYFLAKHRSCRGVTNRDAGPL